MKQRILAFLLALCLLLSLCPFEGTAAAAGESGHQMVAEEMGVLKIVNRERSAQGLSPLTSLPPLQSACDIRAEEISRVFSHTRPDDRPWNTVFAEVGITDYSAEGENIAAGYIDPADVMYGWMHSEGHRANILNGNFRHIGIGYEKVSGRCSWVQLFYTGFVCTYTRMEILTPKGQRFPMGTEAEDMGLVAKLTCKSCGDSYLPVLGEYCSGLDSQKAGEQTLTVSCLGQRATVSITMEPAASGICGENAFWRFDRETKTLTIYGTGAMENYAYVAQPWETFHGNGQMKHIVVEDGITSIGAGAFQFLDEVISLSLGKTLKTIGEMAFYGCDGLRHISVPDSVTALESGAFYFCENLTGISLGSGVTKIGHSAFAGCKSLADIVIPAGVTYIGDMAFHACEGMKEILFLGNAPVFDSTADGGIFYLTTAVAQYPGNNPTWTAEVRQNYGGTITWVPYLANPFTDVPADKYYYRPVMWAYEKGITKGTSGEAFSPDRDCTRAQVVTFLWRAAGEPEPTTTNNPFTDVDSGDFCYKAVLWAVEKGITNGASPTTFNPKGSCTRAQVVTFLWRAAGEPEPQSVENPFVDVPEGKYYHDAVLWAVGEGITNGTGATKFSPNNICNRGQIVTFLYRAYAE